MIINFATSSQSCETGSAQLYFRKNSTSSASPGTMSAQAPRAASDTAEISADSQQRLSQTKAAEKSRAASVSSRAANPITAMNLYRYANVGYGVGDISQKFLNASRVDLSSRIDSILRDEGITLQPDERLSIAVDNDNKFAVAGLKDKKKAKQIADALNADEKLGLDLRKHSAAGRSLKQARLVAQAARGGPKYQEEVDQAVTDPGMRAFILDNYLQDMAAVGLADLSLERDEEGNATLVGGDDRLAALLDADSGLGESLIAILEGGETASYEIHFEFANGMISDAQLEEESREGVKNLYDKINSKVAEFNELIREEEEEQNGFWDPENTQVISGFTIRLTGGDGFEIVGAENLTGRQQRALHQAVSVAIRDYNEMRDAANNSPVLKTDALGAVASLSDIVQAYVDQHQFEHGDTDEYKHMLEISSGSLGPNIKVVSPEADAALENTIQQYAGELGKGLRSKLEDAGVDIGDGIEVEIDSSGKIRVVGDLSDPNLRLAQSILDSVAQELSAGASATDKQTDSGVLEGRMNLKARGIGDYGEHGEEKDKDPEQAWLRRSAFSPVALPEQDPASRSTRIFHSMSNIKPVSEAKPLSQPDTTEKGNAGAATSLGALAVNNAFLPGDMTGLFNHIKELFAQFHDGGDEKNIRFLIV